MNSATNVAARKFLPISFLPSTGARRSKTLDVRTFVSGIQPTGPPHIGNYLGFIRNWLRIQKEFPNDTKLLAIADLHSITLSFPSREKQRQRTLATAAGLLAAGVSPDDTILFQQSAIPEHTMLAWIFSGLTNVKTLERMPQFRDKIEGLSEKDGPKTALLSYPLLQAADILLYKGTDVPVGDDQVQHMQLVVDIARKLNTLAGWERWKIPAILSSSHPRVRSLRNPSKKMSKSDHSNGSRIELCDSREAIRQKCKKAYTDSDAHKIPHSYDPVGRPGISNLILLHSCFSQHSTEEVTRSCEGMSIQQFKEHLADTIEQTIGPIREAYLEAMRDEGRLHEVLRVGNERARELAVRNMQEIKEFLGFS